MRKYFYAAVLVVAPVCAFAQTAPTPVPVPSGSPAASPSPGATPSASPSPGATPSASPLPLPTPLVLKPLDPPQILAVRVSEPVFHSGDTVSATVIASTNVAAVELRVMGKVIRFQRADFGIFQLDYKLPHIPRRFLHDYPAQIVAMNSNNAYVARDITISLR